MHTLSNNPCSRCGKQRIFQESWNEELITSGGTSKIKHTLMVCPDTECQSSLERSLAKLEAQRQERQKIKDELTQARLDKIALSKMST